MSSKQWNEAQREQRPGDAEQWARRHAEALRDEREARERAEHYAAERDKARADFVASAAKLRKLSARASR